MPFLYRLVTGSSLSVQQLQHALQLTLIKHPSLHTSLFYNSNTNTLMQKITQPDTSHAMNINELYSFVESTYETNEQLDSIMHNEKANPHLFDLARGLVFRCHLVYHKQISPDGVLSHNDLIIFNFHHALFDFPSMDIFLHDLDQAYTTGQLPSDNDDATLRYIDCEYSFVLHHLLL